MFTLGDGYCPPWRGICPPGRAPSWARHFSRLSGGLLTRPWAWARLGGDLGRPWARRHGALALRSNLSRVRNGAGLDICIARPGWSVARKTLAMPWPWRGKHCGLPVCAEAQAWRMEHMIDAERHILL